MDTIPYILFLVLGIVIGALFAWILARKSSASVEERAKAEGESERTRLATKLDAAEKRIPEFVEEMTKRDKSIDRLQDKIIELEKKQSELITTLEKERDVAIEKLALVEDAKQKLSEAFTALSKEALDKNSESFVNYAKSVLDGYQQSARDDLNQRQERIHELVMPVKDSLAKVDMTIREVEKAREGAYGELREQINRMNCDQQQLRSETANLVKALRNPSSRGRWGEIQLRRVVELAGMLAYCDFQEQANVNTEDGRLRPDMIINLPSKRTIVVDAKAPMEAFLNAHDSTDDETRRNHLTQHARQMRDRINELSKKSYWNMFQPSPEFVLLFLPNEALYSAALEHDPKLIEDGVSNNVIIATPSTLIALLKAAAYGWKQEEFAKEVEQVSKLGRELYERLVTFSNHITKLGASLTNSVQAYNAMIGSVESRVLISARRFKDLSVTADTSGDIPELQPIETAIRELQAAELKNGEIRTE